MKIIFCIFFLFSIVSHGFSQYTVTKVVGNVTNKMTGEKLRVGSVLNDNDQIAWSMPVSENNMIRAIVAGKGIFIITPNLKAEKNKNEIVEVLKTAFKIKAKKENLSARAENVDLIPNSLETEERVNSNILIAAENKYIFDRNVYNVSDGSKFFLQIEYPGSPPIIRELNTIGDTLILNAADFKVLGKDTLEKVKYKLGYFSKETKTSKSLIEIKSVLDYRNDMETIIRSMLTESKEKDQLKLKQECYAEVYAALGKPANIHFNNAFYKLVSVPLRK